MRRQRVRKILLATALLLFQIKILHLFMSPVVPVFAARAGTIPGSLVVYGALFLSSLFLGRAFCGWFCPGAAMQETLSLIRTRAKAGWADRIKYAICSAWSLLVLVVALRAGGFHGIDFRFGTQHGGLLQEILMRTGHFIVIGALGAAFGAWASCRYICWIAPFLVVGNRIRNLMRVPGLRITVRGESCSECGACRGSCPMRVDIDTRVTGSIRNDDCILCGSCVDACPSRAVQFVWASGETLSFSHSQENDREANRVKQAASNEHRRE
jgi:ferredoxin-type protein NapH